MKKSPLSNHEQYEFFTNDKFVQDDYDEPIEKKTKKTERKMPEIIKEEPRTDEASGIFFNFRIQKKLKLISFLYGYQRKNCPSC